MAKRSQQRIKTRWRQYQYKLRCRHVMPQTMCVVKDFAGCGYIEKFFHKDNPPLVEGSLSSTPATQPLSHSATAGATTQPLSHSEWLSGWVVASHSCQSGWVAEWLRQPLCQSGREGKWLGSKFPPLRAQSNTTSKDGPLHLTPLH